MITAILTHCQQYILYGIKYIIIGLFIGLVISLLIGIKNKLSKKEIIVMLVLWGMTGAYLGFILYSTLFMRHIGERREVSLVPFHILLNYSSEKVYIFENILCFIPLGMLSFFLLGKKSFHPIIKSIIIATILSTMIEVLQFIFALGKSETDDLIFNVIGAFIGCMLCKVVKYLYRGSCA